METHRSCAPAEALRVAIERAAPRLRAISEEDAGRRPAPGKWCAKEVLGHLVDSASNNHPRFVLAPTRDDLVFDGYEQELWVTAQRYAEAPWAELVTLWESFNRHLARVMDAAPRAARTVERREHALDRIAWRTVPADQPVTLEYFMLDYVGHLEHHLEQIFATVAKP